MESTLSINRNDEVIKQTLLLMGFNSIETEFNNGDRDEYLMEFGPNLVIKMTFIRGFHENQVKYWNLFITDEKTHRIITRISYNRGETEQFIISEMMKRMLYRTEIEAEDLMKKKIKKLLS